MSEENLNQQIRQTLNSSQFYYTASGRYSIELAARLLDISKEAHILCPWYICEAALQPFRKLDLPISFYQITSDFNVELEDLERLLNQTKSVGAVLFINYFGFQQNGHDVVNLCREYNIPTIEDNTQSFMSVSPTSSDLLGTIGDIGVFTFRKSAMFLDGAGLSINCRNLARHSIQMTSRNMSNWITVQKARLRTRMRFALTNKNRPLPPLTSEQLYGRGTLHSSMKGYELYRGRMNFLSKLVLKFFDFSRERQHRQEKFERIASHLARSYELKPAVSITPLSNFCPYMLPFFSSNLLEHVNQLRQDGYVVQTWPGPLPREVPHTFSPEALFNQKELGVILLGYY